MSDNDKTVKMKNVPPFSSGTLEQSDRLLQTGMMQPPQAPGTLGTIGKYQVVRVLGEGGMGQVLLAREPVTDSLVAIKIIKPEYVHRDWAVHRFLSEAKHIFNMSHPSIIRVLEVSERPEGPYFVMPFMAGGSLAQKIKPGESLPADMLVSIARHVAEALQYAHSRGVIHRDLKPSNILLDGEGGACLCDFGLLRTVFNDSIVDVTQPQIEGTVPYMSPAVAAGQAEDTRGDIYGFGCLLYEMLTGQPPYQGPTVESVLKQIQAGPPQPIRQVNPSAPARLVTVAESAMARELRDRYADMADVVNDLDRVARGKAPIGTHSRSGESSLGIKIAAAFGAMAVLGLATVGLMQLRSCEPFGGEEASAKATPQNHFNYTTNNNAISITKYIGPGGDVRIPGTINSLPVNSIGNNAFDKCPNLTSVTIPDGATSIGYQAFRDCSSLTNITVPNSITRIGNEVFCGCGRLIKFAFPKGVTSIPSWAFVNCGILTDVTIPASVTSIGDTAFFGCGGLTSLTIPDTVTNIGWGAFFGCRGLTNLAIPKSVISIGGDWNGVNSITVDAENPAYCSVEGVVFNKEKTCLVRYPAGKAGSYVIPNNVTNIIDSAFSGCAKVTDVTIPNSITRIGNRIFNECTSLRSIAIPDSVTAFGDGVFVGCNGLTNLAIPKNVTSIGVDAFIRCRGLNSIMVNATNPAYRSEDGVLFDKQKTCLISYPGGKPGSYEIPNGVTKISPNAFRDCPYLNTVTIPESVTSIGSEAFRGCQNLTAIHFKGSPPRLDKDVFEDSTKIKIHYPTDAKGWGAEFGGRPTALDPSVIPVPVVAAPKAPVVAPVPPPPVGPPASPPEHFTSTSNNGAVTITKYTGPGGAIIIPAKINGLPVTTISDHAFRDCQSLTSVTIPNNVTGIGFAAFRDCTELTAVTIPDGVNSIRQEAFWGCVRLTRIAIPKSVTTIEPVPFAFCANLSSIEVDAANPAFSSSADGVIFNKDKTKLISYPCYKMGDYEIPKGVTEIQTCAFARCFKLTGITIPDGVKVIENLTFHECTALTSVKFPNSLTRIGDQAFHECAKLASVAIPNSVTSIGREAFYDCRALTNVTIGSGVTSIAVKPFLRCNNRIKIQVDPVNPAYCSNSDGVVFNKKKTLLVCCPSGKAGSYEIPKGVTKINEGAFQWCTNLTSVTIPTGVSSIGEQAFLGCSGLTNIAIPGSVRIIENGAFQDCTGLTTVKLPIGISRIGDRAFNECTNLTSVVIPNSVTTLEGWAFCGRSKFTKMTIPESVISLGTNPFTGGWNGGSRLTSIFVEEANPTYSSEDGVLFNKEKTRLISYPSAKVGGYVIPNGVTQLGMIAFEGCVNVTSVTVPSSVASVEHGAFKACPKLLGVFFKGDAPNGGSDSQVFYISDKATVYYHEGTKGWEKTFGGRPAYPLNQDFGYTVENGKVTIAKYAGAGGAVVIPSTINGLPVVRVNDNAFQDCTNLTSIAIPASVTSVGSWAFANCVKLTTVTIPKSVTALHGTSFIMCGKLSSIKVDAENPSYISGEDGVVFTKERNCLVIYPCGRIGGYTVTNRITSIADGAFEQCTNLTSITLPNSLTWMGHYSFANCTSLTNFTVPDSVTGIGWWAFRDCAKLTKLKLPKGFNSIGVYTFWNCYKLASIEVDSANTTYCSSPEGVMFDKKMTRLVYYPCGRGGSYVVPDGVVTIEGSAAVGATNLTSLTIPAGVTSIGSWAFSGCSGLTNICFKGNAPRGINDGSIFGGADKATVYYPAGTTGWGKYFGGRLTAPISTSDYSCSYKDNALTITRYTGTGGAVTIPDTICDLPVTAIGREAFAGCTNMTGVMIPNCVTNIGVWAFRDCTGLTRVTIPKSVTSLGAYERGWASNPFGNCAKLTSIKVDAGNPVFSSDKDGVVFNKQRSIVVCCPAGKAGSYVVPDGVTAVAEGAFQGCAGLTSVTLPGSVKEINYVAFAGCGELTALHFKGDAPEASKFSGNTFDGAGKVKIYYLPESKGWTKTHANRPAYPVRDGYAYTVENNAITIIKCLGHSGAVAIPDKLNGLPVINIGGEAFQNLTNVTSVRIPASVKTISWGAFIACSGLTSFEVDPENSNFSNSKDGVIFSKDKTKLVRYPSGEAGIYVIPSGVTEIVDCAFRGSVALTKVMIPASVTSFGVSEFTYCDQLEAITVDGANNTYWSDSDGVVFSKDKTRLIHYPSGKAGNYVIPHHVTRVESCAFEGCGKLTGLKFSHNVTSMGGNVFMNCSNMVCVVFGDNLNTIGNRSFWDCRALTSVTIPDSVTQIEECAFIGCRSMTNAVVGKGVARLDCWAFGGCSGLTDLCFKGNAPTCHEGAFWGTDKVTVYHQPGATGWGKTLAGRQTAVLDMTNTSFQAAGPQASFICTTNSDQVAIAAYTGNARDVVIPAAMDGLPVTGIKKEAFLNSTVLTSVRIPGSVVNIGNSSFKNCISLTNATIGSGVSIIDDNAFQGCPQLSRVIIPPSVTKIGYAGFEFCSKLPRITIPKSVTSIGRHAFIGCSSLASIVVEAENPVYSSMDGVVFDKRRESLLFYPGGRTGTYSVPDSVHSIENCSFERNTNLTTVTIPTSVTKIGGSAFRDCAGLTGVTIPNGIRMMNWGVFMGCASLTNIVIPASVTGIEHGSFGWCANLKSVHFKGNAPRLKGNAFGGTEHATVYYEPETSGWSKEFSGRPTALLNPRAQTNTGVLSAPAFPPQTMVQAQFNCTTNDSQITIVRYNGSGGNVIIPNSINGLPVTAIGEGAFRGCASLTGATIPQGVVRVESCAFTGCVNLSDITLPGSVTSIGIWAFRDCARLTNVMVSADVVKFIGSGAFANCAKLTSVHFKGGAPAPGAGMFDDTPKVTVYHLLGTAGWGKEFGGRPTAEWKFARE